MRIIEWIGFRIGETIYYVLHKLLGIEPPKFDR